MIAGHSYLEMNNHFAVLSSYFKMKSSKAVLDDFNWVKC